MKIYLDNCCYNRPFDDQTQIRIFLEAQAKLHIQSLIVSKKIELVYSYMSVFENNYNPNKKHLRIISDFFQNASHFVSHTEMQQVEKIAEKRQSSSMFAYRISNFPRGRKCVVRLLSLRKALVAC
jgi:hypothetical protein